MSSFAIAGAFLALGSFVVLCCLPALMCLFGRGDSIDEVLASFRKSQPARPTRPSRAWYGQISGELRQALAPMPPPRGPSDGSRAYERFVDAGARRQSLQLPLTDERRWATPSRPQARNLADACDAPEKIRVLHKYLMGGFSAMGLCEGLALGHDPWRDGPYSEHEWRRLMARALAELHRDLKQQFVDLRLTDEPFAAHGPSVDGV